ncbi:hypothetical protein ElyMa_004789100 [Elysia marginata]|uniref:Uncharacterized protein n=1 Tax=Elysia marginata TaxID=1093978 RepID=A0AAV4IEB3_9GAST|nr:hypothetical protein ElyMa_004789100 [Elysia marginata]
MGKIFSLVVENSRAKTMTYVFMVKEDSSVTLPEKIPETASSTAPQAPPTTPPMTPHPASYKTAALTLGGALLAVLLGIAVLVVCVACRWRGGEDSRFATMMKEKESAKRQRKILRNEKTRPSETTVSQPVSVASNNDVRVFGNTVFSRDSADMADNQPVNKLSLGKQLELRRFNDDYEPTDQELQVIPRSPLSQQLQSNEGIENLYYVPDADLGNGSKPEGHFSPQESEYVVSDYDQTPRNVSAVLNSTVMGSMKNFDDSASVSTGTATHRISELDPYTTVETSTHRRSELEPYTTVDMSKKTSTRRPETVVSTTGSELMAESREDASPPIPPCPEAVMLEAERRIANEASGTEFVVLGPHRKLSLPKDDLGIYVNF